MKRKKKWKKKENIWVQGNWKKKQKTKYRKCTQDDLYGVYMSQIICYTQDCICIQTLLQRHRLLNIKVLSQGF
jgi:hypothetical protein